MVGRGRGTANSVNDYIKQNLVCNYGILKPEMLMQKVLD